MLRRPRLLLPLILALLLTPSVLFAFYRNAVNSQPGFARTELVQGDDTLAGKFLDGARIIRGSPVVGDLDGNPGNGLEIVIGDRNGKLFALNNAGNVLWSQQVANCAVSGDDSLLNGVPTLFDLDPNRPGLEVIVGYGKVSADPSCPGGVRAYAADSAPLWNYQIPISPISGQSGVFSTPSAVDVDGNGDIIIVAGSADLYLHVLNKDGSLRWKYFAMDTIWSSAAFADVNGDGRKDILVGTDFTPGQVCDPNNISPFPETNSRFESAKGFLYAFPADPVFVADPIYCAKDGGQVIGFDKGYLWAVRFDQSIYASPAVADLDGDGSLEVVVGSGCFYGGAPRPGQWVKIFNAANGSERITLNANECVASSPALSDITGDGRLEIVATVASGGSVNPPVGTPATGGRLIAWRFDNPNPLWNVVVQGATQEPADMSEPFNNVLIADVDGNGSHEIVVVVQNSVMIYNGNGQELTRSCPTGGPGAIECINAGVKSMFMWFPVRNTPAIADLDNDGKLEIVVGGSHTSIDRPDLQNRAVIYAWRDLDQAINSVAGPHAPYSAPWPQFQRDPAHNGVLLPRSLRTTTNALRTLTDGSRPVNLALGLRSTDSSAIVVTANVSGNGANFVTLPNLPLTVSGAAAVTFPLVVDASGAAPGTYVATITLSGEGVADVTVTITIRVVDEVFQVFLPVTVRNFSL